MSTDDRRGRCYELALEAFVFGKGPELPDGAVLVHGYPRLQGGEYKGEKYGHAWVEWTESVHYPSLAESVQFQVVWDAVTTDILPLVVYYKAGQIDFHECRTYSRTEAREMAVKHKTYGPWECVPDDAIFGTGAR